MTENSKLQLAYIHTLQEFNHFHRCYSIFHFFQKIFSTTYNFIYDVYNFSIIVILPKNRIIIKQSFDTNNNFFFLIFRKIKVAKLTIKKDGQRINGYNLIAHIYHVSRELRFTIFHDNL